MSKHLAILGAGPVGLEAALAAAEAGHAFSLYEAALEVAGHVADWGHVRLFTPWSMNVSPRAARALSGAGLPVPPGERCPTGHELRRELLLPLASLPAIAPHLHLASRVVAVGRQGLLKHEEIASAERARRPFRLLVSQGGGERVDHADVVLDCTGSYAVPNAVGDGGIPAPGESQLEAFVCRRVPDLSADAESWAGKTILLAGAGHSAQTAARDLAALADSAPATRVIWAVRGDTGDWGGHDDDPLADRVALANWAAALAAGASPAVEMRRGVVIEGLRRAGERVEVGLRRHDSTVETVSVDCILALTGAVGDHTLYRQLQVHECYATCGPMKLAAALLGSGGGDCLAQTSHGADTLKNPEPGFFLLGSKSYGRNNTFLLRVGWDQVSEVMALV